jgi:hypothetical protein
LHRYSYVWNSCISVQEEDHIIYCSDEQHCAFCLQHILQRAACGAWHDLDPSAPPAIPIVWTRVLVTRSSTHGQPKAATGRTSTGQPPIPSRLTHLSADAALGLLCTAPAGAMQPHTQCESHGVTDVAHMQVCTAVRSHQPAQHLAFRVHLQNHSRILDTTAAHTEMCAITRPRSPPCKVLHIAAGRHATNARGVVQQSLTVQQSPMRAQKPPTNGTCMQHQRRQHLRGCSSCTAARWLHLACRQPWLPTPVACQKQTTPEHTMACCA